MANNDKSVQKMTEIQSRLMDAFTTAITKEEVSSEAVSAAIRASALMLNGLAHQAFGKDRAKEIINKAVEMAEKIRDEAHKRGQLPPSWFDERATRPQ